jgi:antitoxin component YwqK of YwqJK toxin-antitoxin module
MCVSKLLAQDSIKNGFVKFYYPNGKVSSEGYMVDGKPDGFWVTYFATGIKKSEGNRRNHLLDSLWLFYNEVGDTTEKINYVLGKRNGYSYKYASLKELNTLQRNVLIAKELFVNDRREGTSYYYYPNGKLKQIINYRNNKKHGESKEYNNEGVLIAIYQYLNDYITEKQNINRTISGVPDGIWQEYNENGTIKSEKVYRGGVLDGYAKEFDQSGKLVSSVHYDEGKIIQDKNADTLNIDERVTYYENKKVKSRYYFRNNIPIGIHRDYNEEGKVIKSVIYNENGTIVSRGIINDDGSREGKWNHFFENGQVKSEGEYVNNRQHGVWQFYFKEGKKEQTGNFSNGYFDGEWTWFYPDGSVARKENYKSGKRDGLFFELSKMGDTTIVGKYNEGLQNGLWIYCVGDIIEKGKYVNDLRQGTWRGYYSNGKLMYEGHFQQGYPNGKFLFYYESGLLKEEQYYLNGIKEKVWKKYNTDGNLFLTILYRSDMEVKVNGVNIAD